MKGEERKFLDGGENGVLILGEILMQKKKSLCDDYILTIFRACETDCWNDNERISYQSLPRYNSTKKRSYIEAPDSLPRRITVLYEPRRTKTKLIPVQGFESCGHWVQTNFSHTYPLLLARAHRFASLCIERVHLSQSVVAWTFWITIPLLVFSLGSLASVKLTV